MDCAFPLFIQFPPEIRQQIWRIALCHCWSFTRIRRVSQRLKLVGEVHREVSQSCREARAIMRTTHIDMADLGGWIDFGHHLFFFRDLKFDRGLMELADKRSGILASVQHIVINPRDWTYLWDTVDLIKSRCASLRTLVIVAPWFDPAGMPDSHTTISYAPFEDWGALFHTSPAEIDLSPLLDDIEHGAEANRARNAQYRTRVDTAAEQVSDDVAQFEHVFGRTRLALERLEQALLEFPNTKPNLYLRSKEELSPAELS